MTPVKVKVTPGSSIHDHRLRGCNDMGGAFAAQPTRAMIRDNRRPTPRSGRTAGWVLHCKTDALPEP